MLPASGLACEAWIKRNQEGSPPKMAFALAFKQCHTVDSLFVFQVCGEKRMVFSNAMIRMEMGPGCIASWVRKTCKFSPGREKKVNGWTVVSRPDHMTGLLGEICSAERQTHSAQDLIGSKLVSWKCLETMVTSSFKMIYKVPFQERGLGAADL